MITTVRFMSNSVPVRWTSVLATFFGSGFILVPRMAAPSILAICFAAGMANGVASAQAVKATIVGTVTDTTGAAIPGAAVTLLERATGNKLQGVTNGSGNFVFPTLSPGNWDVAAKHAGFKTTQRLAVPVTVNSTVRVDLSLQPGDVNQSVIVTSELPLLQTDRADVNASIEAKQVEDLPLGNSRNPQAVQSLLPGVSAPLYIHTTFANPQNAQSFQVNGQAVFSSSVQIEGIDDNERTGQLSVYIPPAAAVQTVNVSTSNYEAEFGRALGAVTNFILKSGTNKFHGSAYEYNEINALAASNYFNSGPKTRLIKNYFGGTLGGPIWKDHTFFFVDVLRSTDHSQAYHLVSVPTAAYRTGDFRDSPTNIYDPGTGTPSGTGRMQFVTHGQKNVIPQDRINPVSAALLALVPLPNVPGNTSLVNNFQGYTSETNDSTSVDFKIDHHFHSDSLSYRYSHQSTGLLYTPLFGIAGGPAGAGIPGAAGTGSYTLWNTAVEYVHPFSPSLLTEVRIGVSHYLNQIRQGDFGSNDRASVGISGGNTDPFNSGMPEINISAFSAPLLGYVSYYPINHSETDISLVNNWTKTIGNHIIKFGGEIRRIRDDQRSSLLYDPRGSYSFSYGPTTIPHGKTGPANSFASFLLDQPTGLSQQTVLGKQTWRQTLFFGFAQDQWDVLPRLTLTYGVRWELYPPATPNRRGGFSQYDFKANTLQLSGYGKTPNDLGLDYHYKDFAPRFGFAFRPTSTSVVRGGFGLSYAPFLDNRYAYGNYPVQQNHSYEGLNSYSAAHLDSGEVATFQQGLPTPQPVAIPSDGLFTSPEVSSSYVIINKHYRDPYVMSYNLTVQQALPHNLSLDVAYVGNQGRQIPLVYNLNAGAVLGAGAAGQPQYATLKRTASSLFFYKTDVSNYNSLQARLLRRFSNGLSLTASYTYQKAMGFNSSSGAISQPTFYVDYRRNYAVLNYNRTHTLTQSFIYELPFGKGKRFLNHGVGAAITGGWQVSSILSEYTGTPLTFSASTTSLNTPAAHQVANEVAPFHKLYGVGRGNPWFDTTAFTQPREAGVYGDTGINIYSGPGAFTLDSSVFRSFPLWEQTVLRLRLDAFHATNTPNFSNPATNVASPSFGIISSASGSRVLQLAGEIRF